MTAMPKEMANGLDIALGARVTSIAEAAGAWEVVFENGTELLAETLLVTAPVPQALQLLKKGISDVPALTIHGNGPFSESCWDMDRGEAGSQLVDAAFMFLGSTVEDLQVHGWRYSKPTTTVDKRYVEIRNSPTLVIAGDAFGGPRVEGAALSGWAAANHLESIRGTRER
jgi:predicted NAD/FAD-dependent oxidoreductase